MTLRTLFCQWGATLYPHSSLFCSDINRRESYYSIPHIHLRDQLRKLDIELIPYEEIDQTNKANLLISVDLPSNRKLLEQLIKLKLNPSAKKILIVMESVHSRPELISKKEFSKWDYVFHYSTLIKENSKIYRYTLPSNLPYLKDQGPNWQPDRLRLIGMMGTNKPSRLSNIKENPLFKVSRGYNLLIDRSIGTWLKLEDGLRLRRLYARFLAQQIPEEFQVFGGQWDGKSYAPHHRLIPPRPNRCAMGRSLANPISIIRGFKFFFALENVIGDDGYLTEKLFNVLRAGSVPIYKPANNSQLFGPPGEIKNLPFIDLRTMGKNPFQLLYRLQSITEDEYQSLVEAGQSFLDSNYAKTHTLDYYASFIAKLIAKVIHN